MAIVDILRGRALVTKENPSTTIRGGGFQIPDMPEMPPITRVSSLKPRRHRRGLKPRDGRRLPSVTNQSRRRGGRWRKAERKSDQRVSAATPLIASGRARKRSRRSRRAATPAAPIRACREGRFPSGLAATGSRGPCIHSGPESRRHWPRAARVDFPAAPKLASEGRTARCRRHRSSHRRPLPVWSVRWPIAAPAIPPATAPIAAPFSVLPCSELLPMMPPSTAPATAPATAPRAVWFGSLAGG